jgi:hypothetical protein
MAGTIAASGSHLETNRCLQLEEVLILEKELLVAKPQIRCCAHLVFVGYSLVSVC